MIKDDYPVADQEGEFMKLNHDCIRALLIYLEENLVTKPNGIPVGLKLSYALDQEGLSEFTQEDIFYAASKLVESKYITLVNKDAIPRLMIIKEISWIGHDYLDSIRDSKVWFEVKEKTKSFSSVAFEVVKSVAVEVTKQMMGFK